MKRGSRLDEIMTLLFMVLAVAAIICFFALGSRNQTYIILGGIAVFLRIAQYIMRFF